MKKWCGFDLDGSLRKITDDFQYDPQLIGPPVPQMLQKLKKHVRAGDKCKIMTARATDPKRVKRIGLWLRSFGLPKLQVTDKKDQDMIKLYDDRRVSVQKNTGKTFDYNERQHREQLKQVVGVMVRQILMQHKKERPKGQNIRRVLRTAKEAGRQGTSWTQLHNAVLGKSPTSDRSSQNRGTNISRINRRAGKSNGRDAQGDEDKSKYQKNPLIKKNKEGKYIITQSGVRKLIQLDKQLAIKKD